MNARAEYLLAFFGICLAAVFLMMVTGLNLNRLPILRWALLAEWAALFVAIFWLQRQFRGRLPRPTVDQTLKGARAARKLSLLYFAGLVIGVLTCGHQLLSFPYGVGFVGPLVAILLGTYYLRLSIKLNRATQETKETNPTSI